MKYFIKFCRNTVYSLALSVLLGGCILVGPDYETPETPLPEKWSAEAASGLNTAASSPEILSQWWKTLNDPILTELIEKARANNLDLVQAQARVRQARAKRNIARANLFPTIDLTGAASRSRSSQEAGSGDISELYSNGLDASWELDLFGKNQRNLESAEASLEASTEDLNDVLVSLFAEVALDYVDVRLYQKKLAILESNIDTLTETYDITRWRRESGLTSQLDVDQALQSLEVTRAGVPVVQTSLAQTKHALSVLIGQEPSALNDVLKKNEEIPVPPVEVAIGIPADCLRHRPDVRRAERELAAQTAQVGVATAAQYPTFSLVGSIGLNSLSFGNLYSSSAYFWKSGGNATWTLFDGGQIRGNIEVQSALQEQALGAYESSVLTALKDVEDVLVAYVNEKTRYESLVKAVKAGESALELARSEYVSGLTDFQAVLDSQRSLLSAQEQLATSEGNLTANTIRLYKALGGGWTPETPVDNVEQAKNSGAKL